MRKLPRRSAPILYGAILSALMVSVVSAIVLILNRGFQTGLLMRWFHSVVATWPIAFPVTIVVAPVVRRLVDRITKEMS